MNRNGQLCAGLYCRDGTSGQRILGHFADVDVASELGPSAAVDDAVDDLLVTDDGRVLLARVDLSAISGDGAADPEANRRRRAGLSLSSNDDAVGVGKSDKTRQGEQLRKHL